MFLPKVLKRNIVAIENVSLGFAHVRDTDRERAAWTQSALAIPGVLPEMPVAPGRGVTRLRVVVRDPEPAVGKNRAIGSSRAAAPEHRAQTIFAAVNPRVFSGPLFDSLDESGRLRGAHRAAAIMRVLFEIEHEQNAGPIFFLVRRGIHNRMRRSDRGEEVVRLLDRIRGVAKMIRAPQQTGSRRFQLSLGIAPVALQTRKARLVNDADDAFALHRHEVHSHQIIVRQVHDAVAGESGQGKN